MQLIVTEDFPDIAQSITSDTTDSTSGSINGISKSKARQLRRKRAKLRLKSSEDKLDSTSMKTEVGMTNSSETEKENSRPSEKSDPKKKKKQRKKRTKGTNDEKTKGPDQIPSSSSHPVLAERKSNAETEATDVSSNDGAVVAVAPIGEEIIEATNAFTAARNGEQNITLQEINLQKQGIRDENLESDPCVASFSNPMAETTIDVYCDENVEASLGKQKETCECNGCIIS